MHSYTAVIFDWGGVISAPIRDVVKAWADADRIDWDSYVAAVTPWLAGAYEQAGNTGPGAHAGTGSQAGGEANPVHLLERGECTDAEFERIFAARLVHTDGGAVAPEGILKRMMRAGERPVPAMYDLIRGLRGEGLRTGLLSNSWGSGGYPRQDFPELFDAVVISGEVGMRKPEPRIFRHAATRLDLAPEECVFVDDIQANVDAASACGMTGVHHTDTASTVARLTELFGER